MPLDERWDALDDSQWTSFADEWLAELVRSDQDTNIGESVTWMMFTARPERQWKFILLATDHANNDYHLGHIAAGPVERLLGKHGNDYIDAVEQHAQTTAKFAKMLTGVRQYLTPEDTWNRLKVLQSLCTDPLTPTITEECHSCFIELEERHKEQLEEALKHRTNNN